MLKFLLLSSLFVAQSSTVPEIPEEFLSLKNKLEKYGFSVIINLPPQNIHKQKAGFHSSQRAYGLLESASKKIWINPVVFELGIGTPTLIHESVHAAQVCSGNGQIKTLGVNVKPIDESRPFFLRYSDIQRQDLEKEAYAIQTQSNSFELVTSLLEKNCQGKFSIK
jgi:hypothetical protein